MQNNFIAAFVVALDYCICTVFYQGITINANRKSLGCDNRGFLFLRLPQNNG